jgi:Initiator Replication protein
MGRTAHAIDYYCDVKKSTKPAIVQDNLGFDMRRREVNQPSLFPLEDLIIPQTVKNMRKAVSAIHAVPTNPEHSQSLNSRRLFDACIIVAQLDFKKRDKNDLKRVKDERISPMFETHITNLARLANIPGKNYARIYEELDTLFEMSLQWNLVGEDATVEWEMKSHFMACLGYGKGHKRGLVRFAIDPGILQIVLEPSNWANLSLQVMQGLSTASSYALYQNCWRYIGTQAKVTAAMPTATWIELLLGPSRHVVKDDIEGTKVVNYGDFKRRHLIDAIRRVNEVAALSHTIELKEHFSGNRVSKIQFKFVQKKQQTLGLPVTWPEDVIVLLGKLGYTHQDIEHLSQVHSYEVVAESLVRLKSEEGKRNAQGKPIKSHRAFFTGILANVAAATITDEIDPEKMEAEVIQQEEQRLADARLQRRREGFQEHVASQFTRGVFELSEPERNALFSEFEASAAGKKATLLLERGWNARNTGAMSLLRGWMVKEKDERMKVLLSRPQDRDFDAWLAWKLDSLE